MKNRLDDITDLMALGPTPDARDIQRRQTAHRIAIADALGKFNQAKTSWKSAAVKVT